MASKYIRDEATGQMMNYAQAGKITGVPYGTIRFWYIEDGVDTVEKILYRRANPKPKGKIDCSRTPAPKFNRGKSCLRDRGMSKCKHHQALTETFFNKKIKYPEPCLAAHGDYCKNYERNDERVYQRKIQKDYGGNYGRN